MRVGKIFGQHRMWSEMEVGDTVMFRDPETAEKQMYIKNWAVLKYDPASDGDRRYYCPFFFEKTSGGRLPLSTWEGSNKKLGLINYSRKTRYGSWCTFADIVKIQRDGVTVWEEGDKKIRGSFIVLEKDINEAIKNLKEYVKQENQKERKKEPILGTV